MLKVQEIRELIKLIDESSIDEFEYEHEDSKVVLKKNVGVVQQVSHVQMHEQPLAPHAVHAAPAPQDHATIKSESVQPSEQEPELETNLHKIEAPMVGTFYASPSPDTDYYVKKGSKVEKDSVVCIVEAMKLFNEIEADVKGEIVEVLVENGQLVEYGQPLFLVKTE